MLVILSGSSGAGKNTVISEILRSEKDYGLLPTFTTREKRENEKQGNPYCFITEDVFKSMLENDLLYEHQIIHNHYYGVGKEKLLELSKQHNILIKDIDVLGTLNILRMIPKEINVLTFFLRVPKNELTKRLKQRGETDIEFRLKRCDMENELASYYDYILENTDLKTTVGLIKTIVSYELNNNYLLPTVKADTLSKESVTRLIASAASSLVTGNIDDFDRFCFPSIKAAVIDSNVYVIDGHHEYLASKLSGMHIAKEIVSSDIDVSEDC